MKYKKNVPYITVLLPVYNAKNTLADSIISIQNQTYQNWELLILNEFGSDDGSLEIAKSFLRVDKRIRLIQNSQKLGLARTLNRGIIEAKGQLIARIDADDISYSTRFEKQIKFFEEHPSVGICGTWQKHVSKTREWIHKPPIDDEFLAISLLFSCEMCHSTIMMRKKVLIKNNLFYDPRYQAEDFELWSRAICVTKLSNIPEVLGEYRHGNNISDKKKKLLEEEHGKICAKTIYKILGVHFDENQQFLLNSWRNIFCQNQERKMRNLRLSEYKQMLISLDIANKKMEIFSIDKFRGVLKKRWAWANWNICIKLTEIEKLESVFKNMPFNKLIRIWQIFKSIRILRYH